MIITLNLDTTNSWTSWVDGECSTTCGNGIRNRTRTCDTNYELGTLCEGAATEVLPCNIAECGKWIEHVFL